jgi:hypothetical protein
LDLVDTKCEKFQISKCLQGTKDTNGIENCVSCVTGYAVYGNECVKVKSDDSIKNCYRYLTNKSDLKIQSYISKTFSHVAN